VEYPTTFTTQTDEQLSNIVTRVIHADTADGLTKVPITISHHKDLPMDGNNPTLVKVYGACSFDAPVEFDPSHAVLLKQGWVVASAHVRGGGELGIDWYVTLAPHCSELFNTTSCQIR
jgi:prolyl oligopeptidase